uniref:Uncharacterized protein n=1 Tax=Arundo donax TaxID=35708 RepID=A0A0A9GIF6_ARUDO
MMGKTKGGASAF